MTRFSMVLLAVLFAAPAATADRPAKPGQSAVHCTYAPASTGSHIRRRICSPSSAKKAAAPVGQERKATAKK